ncbi:glycogen/starch/alpha-glucan phosphorylase [Cyanobium gracile]|uniref:Alpha-1,4 glucan phosphorylase n=1 Tax=Cyanobium gracile UHCC 0281 TaxID=3110309 RepID=A0ABU5SSE1_9CYAN|nr:glycogen/starch/alpha-glucan phosphorylase [Cyanobium gracile]MEA5441444.1 glycogen/starch/alpha-glucan phosphorylase [Cyanobium gracile UHCC 0281]
MGLPEPGTYGDPQRNGLRAKDLYDAVVEHLFYSIGRRVPGADRHDLYMALSYAVRDRLMTRYLAGLDAVGTSPSRMVAYLSAEFLIGPQLGNNLLMLGIQQEAAEALKPFGINDIDDILHVETEPGLGNGGLGRLAACFLESLASLEIPATGYGIRYEFGIFDQLIRDGWQVEITDKWLKAGWPWEIPHPDQACFVGFGGHTESHRDQHGAYRVRWIPAEHAIGIPHDVPVLGYRVNTCNRLRLWRAEANDSFDFQTFNRGDYSGAVEKKVGSETLSKVLYPNDGTDAGRRLRLKQQHFFVSCSLQDMIRGLDARGIPVQEFPVHWAIQLNDTHPSIAVAELMRLLLDDKHLEWEAAWAITTACLSYTNHTLLPEALETWGLDLFGSLLPRHLELIFEINRRFLQQVRLRHPGNEGLLQRVSIIDETGGKAVRMAHLATIASHHVNGVAALHSELVKQELFPEFAALWPNKFTNVTNGVTPRRWLALAHPALDGLLGEVIGPDWPVRMEDVRQLEAFQHDAAFLERWSDCKRSGKQRLAAYILRQNALAIDPDSLFDVQVKRIHEYKRQHLNALQVIALYLRIKNGDTHGLVPRTVIFAGKAAPGYAMAKLIIRFINGIAEVVNADPTVNQLLRVVFLADYNVKLSERVYPAADLSEQISTAGLEASGTGNMKFMMNGALTIGTLDGANVEIREEVGDSNFFLFGHTAEGIARLHRDGYRPWERIAAMPLLQEVLGLIGQGHFSRGDRDLFQPLLNNLSGPDPFCVVADFEDYLRAQQTVASTWADRRRWSRMTLLNTARSAYFSSDRAIAEYAEGIWEVKPVPVAMRSLIEA